jgi:hypothetical protein
VRGAVHRSGAGQLRRPVASRRPRAAGRIFVRSRLGTPGSAEAGPREPRSPALHAEAEALVSGAATEVAAHASARVRAAPRDLGRGARDPRARGTEVPRKRRVASPRSGTTASSLSARPHPPRRVWVVRPSRSRLPRSFASGQGRQHPRETRSGIYDGASPGVRPPSTTGARAIVGVAVYLTATFRSQGFSPSQRFDPARASWLCFAPQPPVGFGPPECSPPCQPRRLSAPVALLPLGWRCPRSVARSRTAPPLWSTLRWSPTRRGPVAERFPAGHQTPVSASTVFSADRGLPRRR